MIQQADDIAAWLPMTEQAIEKMADDAVAEFQQGLSEFLATEERTFDNTIRTWDLLQGMLKNLAHWRCEYIIQIHPDKAVRDCAMRVMEKIDAALLDAYEQHPEIYTICKSVPEPQREEERYYYNHLLSGFRHQGLQLGDEDRARALGLRKEILLLGALFERNIQEDPTPLFVPRAALTGLSDSWIDARPTNETGEVRLIPDYPTYGILMRDCSVPETRAAFYNLFGNRGAPQNEAILAQLSAKRDEFAKLFGYPNFAAYDVSDQMAQTVDVVDQFLADLFQRSQQRSNWEFQQISPAASSIKLSDLSFLFSEYKKRHFSIDQTKISEYFPLEETLRKLLDLYEEFFSLSIREVSHSIPIPGMRALEVRDRSNRLLSIILLDIFPREGKYTHACDTPLIPAFSPPGGPRHPAVSGIVTNFTKPFLTHNEVATFFHEFGHAIHDTMGASEFCTLCGTETKVDFVELPSQLLEEFVWDSKILKRISSHYLTKEPLSDEQIDQLIRARQFGIGYLFQRQCYQAALSLALYRDIAKNPKQIAHSLQTEMLPRCSFEETDNWHLSFGHLGMPLYAAKYYSYAWSKVFALDILEKLRQGGLTNPKMGDLYVETILRHGGGRDPNQMLVDFLGRSPSSEAFFSEIYRFQFKDTQQD
jgi:thimet oligopeptidase